MYFRGVWEDCLWCLGGLPVVVVNVVFFCASKQASIWLHVCASTNNLCAFLVCAVFMRTTLPVASVCRSSCLPNTTVQTMIIHVIASPLMVPLTAMVPYHLHLWTVVLDAVGAWLTLAGVTHTPGLCTALYANRCNARAVIDNLCSTLLGMGPSTTSPRACALVLWSVHMAASLLLTAALYYTELRWRLRWLALREEGTPGRAAAVALLHAGSVLTAWTLGTVASLVLAVVGAVLVLGSVVF